jgi:hypothetical protein
MYFPIEVQYKEDLNVNSMCNSKSHFYLFYFVRQETIRDIDEHDEKSAISRSYIVILSNVL